MSGVEDLEEARKARALGERLDEEGPPGDAEAAEVWAVARAIRGVAGGELRGEEKDRVAAAVFGRKRSRLLWSLPIAAAVLVALLSAPLLTGRAKRAAPPAAMSSVSLSSAAHAAIARELPGTETDRAEATLAALTNDDRERLLREGTP